MPKLGPIEVRECEEVPAGFGVAYRDPAAYRVICYRWPLNHLVSWAKSLWWWARHARTTEWENLLADEYRRGHREGYAWGLKCGANRGGSTVHANGVWLGVEYRDA